MFKKPLRPVLIVLGVICALIAIYNIPFVNDRLAWRVDGLVTQVRYYFNPPAEAVFVPAELPPTPALVFTATVTPPAPQTELPLEQGPTATPTITPTPVPERISLPGVRYFHQHNRWNYCGPANLAMGLTYWGWAGLPGNTNDLRDQIAAVVKPGENDPNKSFIERGKTDKNVSPAEMLGFVNNQTPYKALMRYGGDLALMKSLIAAGFPPIIEKGYYERDYTGKIGWMGHYLFVTGYDQARRGFIVQDAYLEPGQNLFSPYDEFEEGWRSFNYLFIVVYPPDREADLLAVLGNWSEPAWANRRALELATTESQLLTGIDEYFAWFNRGTANVEIAKGMMGQNPGEAQAYFFAAAEAYDTAFRLYAALDTTQIQRPYRMMWYQTGPYWAYFYSGRYADVVNLANTTLYDTISEPTLEESLYWRALARYAQGDSINAISDLRQILYLNHRFDVARSKLQEWGVTP
jgi:tetratricopeptide (TPR) repeat protein